MTIAHPASEPAPTSAPISAPTPTPTSSPPVAAEPLAARAAVANATPARWRPDPARPLIIVLNGGSGAADAADERAAIEGVLNAAGRPYRLHLVTEPRHMPQIAAAAVRVAQAIEGDMVVAGGDGTINTVANAVIGSGCALGVLPQGTFNYFARAHGIPLDTAEATRALLTAHAVPVQVGRVNGRVFLVNASLGLYPTLLEDREAYKRQFGRSRIVAAASALFTLLRDHRPLRLRIDDDGGGAQAGGADAGSAIGRELRTPTLFVGNNALQLEQIGMAEACSIRDGRLAGVALRPVGSATMLWLALRGALGNLGDAEDVLGFSFRHITVRPRGARHVKVAADGETAWMRAPIVFQVSPQPLMLLKPSEPGDAVAAPIDERIAGSIDGLGVGPQAPQAA